MNLQVFRAVALVVLLQLSAPFNAYAQCGGVERWAVKVGNDDAAKDVDISDLDNAKPITPKAVNNLPDPRDKISTKENVRLPEEHQVHRVNGRLVYYKLEGGTKGDSDYHLVITDSSLKYTKGGAGTKPTGTSFIAEIPHPDCFSGGKGAHSKTSVFGDLIKQVRQDFEARFPDLEDEKESIDVPVVITGIVFYDKDHGQIGRARNGFEIHPVLKIEFPGQPTPFALIAATSPAANLLVNPGFEEGNVGWRASTNVIQVDGYPAALSGDAQAVLGGTGIKAVTRLWQRTTLPKDVAKIMFSFRMRIRSEEPPRGRQARDFLRVQVRDGKGNLLKTLDLFSNLDANPRYKRYSYDLTRYRGRVVNVGFVATENGRNATSFLIDDTLLNATRQ